MDIWVLCKNEGGNLTGVGIETTEAKCLDMAGDGQFFAIPIRFGRLYENIIDAGIVGTVPFSSEALKTLVQQVKARLDSIDADIQQIKTAGQAMNQAIQDLDARVTALEEVAIQQP